MTSDPSEEQSDPHGDQDCSVKAIELTDPLGPPLDAPIPPGGRPEPIWFERLADDALSEDQRRDLIGRLDVLPDGWKACALALLEAQAFRTALQDESIAIPLETEILDRDAVAASTPRSMSFAPQRSRLETTLRTAALLLIGLGLGWWLGGLGADPAAPMRSDPTGGSGPVIADRSDDHSEVLPAPDATRSKEPPTLFLMIRDSFMAASESPDWLASTDRRRPDPTRGPRAASWSPFLRHDQTQDF